MRHRERVTGAFDRLAVYEAFQAPSGDVYYHVEELVGTKETKVIEDTPIPAFAQLRRCGAFLPLNSCLISKVKETRTPGSGGFHLYNTDGSISRWSSGELWNAVTGHLTVPSPDPALAEDAVTRAAADCADATWDTLTFLAEAKESYEMVGGAIRKLYDRFVIPSALRAAKEARRGILRRFSEIWLSYRYGWMPLVYDVQDAAEAIASRKRKFDLKKGRGHNSTTWNDSTTWSVNTGTETWYYAETLSVSSTYRGKAYARIVDPTKNTWGFDPISTAWEVVPYSFVVDWFIGVGNWLKSIMPASSGVEFLGCCGSLKQVVTHVITTDIVWDVLANTDGAVSGMKTETVSEIYRRDPTGIPSLPHFNVRLNAVRLTDLFALVAANNRRVARILGI